MAEESNIFDEILDRGLEFKIENCVKRMDGTYKVRTLWAVKARQIRFDCRWEGFDTNSELKKDLADKFHNVILPYIVEYDKKDTTRYIQG